MSGQSAAIPQTDNTELRNMSSFTESGKCFTKTQVSQYHAELAELSEGKKKKLLRKIDIIILPQLAVCYMFFYIDKTTLSYAKLFGIEKDLNLVGKEYSWLSSIFYFGFMFWAFPTNLLMQKVKVNRYLGVNIFVWGAMLMLQAVARNFTELAILRAIGGAAEACADPSFMMITSMWYTRREQPIRIGLWYTANGLGIAGGGMLAYTIGNIKGHLPAWKYEFIVIGALCCFWGIFLYLFLPDGPATAYCLSETERKWAVERLRENQTGVENKGVQSYQIIEALKDIKLYLCFLLGFVANIPNGGISNFGTVIVRGIGFSSLMAAVMQIPYGAFIAISILACVFLNDYTSKKGYQSRCYFVIAFMIPNICGTLGLAFLEADNKIGRLLCYYLTGPYNAAFVLVLSLQTSNIAGHTKKQLLSGGLFLGYCVGNIVGPFFYKEEQAPGYKLGIWSMLVSHLLEVVVILVLRTVLSGENKKRDQGQGIGEFEKVEQKKTREKERASGAFNDLTDGENFHFRYIY